MSCATCSPDNSSLVRLFTHGALACRTIGARADPLRCTLVIGVLESACSVKGAQKNISRKGFQFLLLPKDKQLWFYLLGFIGRECVSRLLLVDTSYPATPCPRAHLWRVEMSYDATRAHFFFVSSAKAGRYYYCRLSSICSTERR